MYFSCIKCYGESYYLRMERWNRRNISLSMEICKIFLFLFVKLSEKDKSFQIPGIPVIVYLGVFILAERKPRFDLLFDHEKMAAYVWQHVRQHIDCIKIYLEFFCFVFYIQNHSSLAL